MYSMLVSLALAGNHFDDDNNGLKYGIIQIADSTGNDCSDYVEWFKTKEEREQVIKDNKLGVISIE